MALLNGAADITFEQVDLVFHAFGFRSEAIDWQTDAYSHPRHQCGIFIARDDGLHVLSPTQRGIVRGMIQVLQLSELGD